MNLTYIEKEFIRQTLNALNNGSRIDKKHYNLTISKEAFNKLQNKFNEVI